MEISMEGGNGFAERGEVDEMGDAGWWCLQCDDFSYEAGKMPMCAVLKEMAAAEIHIVWL